MKRSNFPDRKAQKKAAAEVRQAAYDKVPYEVKLKNASEKEKEKLLDG